MATPDDHGLPEDPRDLDSILREVAVSIGRFLPKSGPRLSIGEVLPVWVAQLTDVQGPGGLSKAADQNLWQIQLRPAPGDRATAFARVKDLSGAAEVQGVYVSSLAGQIDDAIDEVDRNHPEDTLRARLLDVPEAHLTLLWLTGPGGDRLIFLDDALAADRKWRKFEDLSGGEFRDRLQSLEPILAIEPWEGEERGPTPAPGSAAPPSARRPTGGGAG